MGALLLEEVGGHRRRLDVDGRQGVRPQARAVCQGAPPTAIAPEGGHAPIAAEPPAAGEQGIQTGPDARFFAIAAPFEKTVDTTGKELVVQARALT